MRGRLTDETPSFPYPGETVFSDTERNKKAQEFLVVLSLLFVLFATTLESHAPCVFVLQSDWSRPA